MIASLSLIDLVEAVVKSWLITDLLTGRIRVPKAVAHAIPSANGAPSNQPGASPQVTRDKHPKG